MLLRAFARKAHERWETDDRWEHDNYPPPPVGPDERLRGTIIRFGEAVSGPLTYGERKNVTRRAPGPVARNSARRA
jgi:hypothetical protein